MGGCVCIWRGQGVCGGRNPHLMLTSPPSCRLRTPSACGIAPGCFKQTSNSTRPKLCPTLLLPHTSLQRLNVGVSCSMKVAPCVPMPSMEPGNDPELPRPVIHCQVSSVYPQASGKPVQLPHHSSRILEGHPMPAPHGQTVPWGPRWNLSYSYLSQPCVAPWVRTETPLWCPGPPRPGAAYLPHMLCLWPADRRGSHSLPRRPCCTLRAGEPPLACLLSYCIKPPDKSGSVGTLQGSRPPVTRANAPVCALSSEVSSGACARRPSGDGSSARGPICFVSPAPAPSTVLPSFLGVDSSHLGAREFFGMYYGIFFRINTIKFKNNNFRYNLKI